MDFQTLTENVPVGIHPSAATRPAGPLPPEVVVLEHFLAPETCRDIVAYADAITGQKATVRDNSRLGEGLFRDRHSAARVTEIIPLEGIARQIVPIFAALFREHLGRIYQVSFEWFETPQLLRYRPGGRYNRHSDGECFNSSSRQWIRSLDRDYSVLLYLNDDYRGGALSFPHHRMRIFPSPGMLIAFPSDHRYIHAAETLESGQRYALVSWAAIHGSARVNPEPPDVALYLQARPTQATAKT